MNPVPCSAEELAQFAALQERLGPMFSSVFGDSGSPRTVLVNPSLSLDPEILANIAGLLHYEERMLCMLMLLSMPRTRVVYVSSVPIDSAIVDYYLHLLPGIPSAHARRRLVMLSCHDSSASQTLTAKLLARPRMLERIRRAVGDPSVAHMTCFNVTAAERTLAVQVGIPIYGNDPALEHLGSKSGGRRVFHNAGVQAAPGCEGLRDERDIACALAELKGRDPTLRRAAVKLEYGCSGEGNAVFSFGDESGNHRDHWIESQLAERLRFEDTSTDWERYRAKFREMGGIVESWIDGEVKASPSVQCRITPLRQVEVISTHDQVLGGPSNQIFLGCTFPAHDDYRLDIQEAGSRVAEVLRERDALGRFSVDFVSVRGSQGWQHYAIEINLRKGGTTHTYRILELLTGGSYDLDSGLFRTPAGEPRCYQATDNLTNDAYRRLTPDDLIDVLVENRLHFNPATQEGVFFHLIGALSGYGKLGAVCVARDPSAASRLYEHTAAVLDRAAQEDAAP